MPQASEKSNAIAIIATRGDFPAIYEVVTLATAYGALGKQVHLVFAWGALRRLLEGTLDELEVNPADGLDEALVARLKGQAAAGELPSQAGLLEELREMGLVNLYACSGSLSRLGYTAEQVADKVDQVVGVTSFVNEMDQAERIIFL